MRVQIAKRADGCGVLRCIRDDGSTAWQKQPDRYAAFFALHDLTHFAVETTLAYRRGFFGLVAEAAGFPVMFLFAMAGVVTSLGGWIAAFFREARA